MDDSIFNLEYPDSVPVLTKAVRAGDLRKIKKLLAQGSQPQTPDNRGWTAIHCSVAENQLKPLKLILETQSESKKYLVNLATWENVTPLHIALKSTKPSVKMVKILLEAGADPNHCTHMNLSPLHLACMKKGNLHLVKLLVESGADVNVQEHLCLLTPLHIAICKSRDLKIIEFLLHLSDLNLKNDNDRTAFLEACNSNFPEAVKLFLSKDKNLANIHYGLPPLAYAGAVGNLEMTQMLLNSNANVNVKCKAMVFCRDSDDELILLDRESFLPIHSSLKNIEVFELLLKLTKNRKLLRLEGNYYSFPLFVMVYGGEAFMIKLLQSKLPDYLKAIDSEVLVKFFITHPDMGDVVIERMPLIFKYNLGLEPKHVLQCFASEISTLTYYFTMYYKLSHMLAKMGVSSHFQYRNELVNILENMKKNCSEAESRVITSTCDLLSISVLSLKQYCRIVVRRHIRKSAKSDLSALKIVEELELPVCLKKYLLFDSYVTKH